MHQMKVLLVVIALVCAVVESSHSGNPSQNKFPEGGLYKRWGLFKSARQKLSDAGKGISDFSGELGNGLGSSVKSVGNLVINPVNTERAVKEKYDKFSDEVKQTGFKDASKRAATSAYENFKSGCEGKSKAACVGKTLGSLGGVGTAAASIEKSAKKHAEINGDKDNAGQV